MSVPIPPSNGTVAPSADSASMNTVPPSLVSAPATTPITIRINRGAAVSPTPSLTGVTASHPQPVASSSKATLLDPVELGRSVPAPRSATPPHVAASIGTTTPVASGKMLKQSMGDRKPSAHRGETKRKPTFTSVLSFHRPESVQNAPAPATDEQELSRSSRRSKVQAISKLDRAGTPGSAVAGPSTGTSFVPNKASVPVESAPGPSRNPLHRAPVVNPPFDLATVRTTAPRHPPPRSEPRLFGLREAPVYYPTAEQFSDPLAYVASLPSEAREAGICKIVPPEGWAMPFCVESESFRFKTRLQRLNQLEAASRAKLNFLEQVHMFHMQQGDSTVTIPVIDRRPLDIWRLRKEVAKMGGYDNVTAIKGWERITEIMGYAAGWSHELKSAYGTVVLPFERFMARAKSHSVSPLTPLSTMKAGAKPPGWTDQTPGSPTSASGAKAGRMGAVKPSTPSSSSGSKKGRMGRMSGLGASTRPKRGASPSLALATSVSLPEVRTVDFANGNASSSTTPQPQEPVTAGPRLRIPGFDDRDGTDSDLSDESLSPPPPPPKQLSVEPYQKGEVCEVCRRGNQADKILLCDGCDRGFHIFCLEPPLEAVPTNEEWFCTPCLLSQGDDFGFEEGEEHSLASFAARDQAFSEAWWHKFKGHPKAPGGSNGIPRTPIQGGDGEDRPRGDEHSRSPSAPLSPVASTATSAQADGTPAAPATSPVSKKGGRNAPVNPLSRRFGRAVVSEDDVEREFWRLAESSYDTVEVEYGADVHSTTHGSAAPTMETHPLDPYSQDGWNLNNMPILPDSVLRYIKSDISGMTVPWIYIGMMFSAFCWHNEDHYTYSINYMFWGETKTWYGIPGSDAEKFEAAIKGEAPELFEQQPGLLYQLVTMMNPGRLKEEGVDVLAVDQRPNEFVITFPKAYHCGFNHGINFNEAVNFALPDWLSHGKEAVRKYREYAKPPVFSHNELLISITLYSDTIKTALWRVVFSSGRSDKLTNRLRQSLADMVAAEAKDRDELRARIANLAEKLEEEDCPEEQYQCCVCKAFSYLSQVTCKCTKLVSCLEHADQLCGCPSNSRTMRKRYSESQLDEILAIVETRAAIPRQWRERFEAVLASRRPALKTMRGLLTDGERIPYPLEELESLRALVTRANGWVDKVQNLTQRKTAVGRRRKRQETEDDEFARTPEYIKRLLKEVDRLAFDAPEIQQLRHEVASIDSFKTEARMILSTPSQDLDLQSVQTAAILGQSLMAEMPEVAQVQNLVNRLQWFRQVEDEVDDRTLQYEQVVRLLDEARQYGIPDEHETIQELRRRETKGRQWKKDVERLETAESITIAELDSLIDGQELTPTVEAKMHTLEGISRNIQHWRTQADSIIAKNGPASSAQRLIKQIASSGGIASKIIIPEIEKLSLELEYHDQWIARLADILGERPNKVSTRLAEIQQSIRQRLSPNDNEPNEELACFCRLSADSPGTFVSCDTCDGWYHAKCVNLNTRTKMPDQWKCQMCKGTDDLLEGRPSLHALAALTDKRWNLVIRPAELSTLFSILEMALEAGRRIVPLIQLGNEPKRRKVPPAKRSLVVDENGEAVEEEMDEDERELAQVTHWCRKLYTMPITFDAVNRQTNERVVFEEWLFRRMRLARQPAVPPSPEVAKVEVSASGPDEPLSEAAQQQLTIQHRQLLANGIPIMSEKMRLSRVRRPKLILAEALEKEFKCICTRPPVDALVTAWCYKCGQGYHASCVRAALVNVSAGPEQVHAVDQADASKWDSRPIGERRPANWRCPCCAAREGKTYMKGVEVRVQLTEHLGTDTYIDCRQTVNNYVDAPFLFEAPPIPCILLHCVQFIPAVRAEDVHAPARELNASTTGVTAGGFTSAAVAPVLAADGNARRPVKKRVKIDTEWGPPDHPAPPMSTSVHSQVATAPPHQAPVSAPSAAELAMAPAAVPSYAQPTSAIADRHDAADRSGVPNAAPSSGGNGPASEPGLASGGTGPDRPGPAPSGVPNASANGQAPALATAAGNSSSTTADAAAALPYNQRPHEYWANLYRGISSGDSRRPLDASSTYTPSPTSAAANGAPLLPEPHAPPASRSTVPPVSSFMPSTSGHSSSAIAHGQTLTPWTSASAATMSRPPWLTQPPPLSSLAWASASRTPAAASASPSAPPALASGGASAPAPTVEQRAARAETASSGPAVPATEVQRSAVPSRHPVHGLHSIDAYSHSASRSITPNRPASPALNAAVPVPQNSDVSGTPAARPATTAASLLARKSPSPITTDSYRPPPRLAPGSQAATSPVHQQQNGNGHVVPPTPMTSTQPDTAPTPRSPTSMAQSKVSSYTPPKSVSPKLT